MKLFLQQVIYKEAKNFYFLFLYMVRSLSELIFLGLLWFATCSLAVSLVFAHFAVLLAIAEPLQRDAEIIVTLELVISTAFFTASLQPNTIKAQYELKWQQWWKKKPTEWKRFALLWHFHWNNRDISTLSSFLFCFPATNLETGTVKTPNTGLIRVSWLCTGGVIYKYKRGKRTAARIMNMNLNNKPALPLYCFLIANEAFFVQVLQITLCRTGREKGQRCWEKK